MELEAKLVGELRAAFACCRAVAPRMVARRAGSIVFVSSGQYLAVSGGIQMP